MENNKMIALTHLFIGVSTITSRYPVDNTKELRNLPVQQYTFCIVVLATESVEVRVSEQRRKNAGNSPQLFKCATSKACLQQEEIPPFVIIFTLRMRKPPLS
jgi:hypothetical protein